MKYRIWLSSPNMSYNQSELGFFQEAFDSNWIAPLGPNVTSFELEVNQFVGSINAVALTSGTAAIHMALKAVGI